MNKKADVKKCLKPEGRLRFVQTTVDFAVAASALKHLIAHDVSHVGVSEIGTLAAGIGTGRVRR